MSARPDLIEALATGDRIVCTPESDWLDFKRGPIPYDMEPRTRRLTEKSRWELAKDVGALANHGPGFLVLGFATERAEGEAVEVATSIELVHQDAVDWTTYQDVIKEWLYPRVRNLTGRWYAANDDEGVFLIDIPAQDPSDQPFVLRRVYRDEMGTVLTGGHFAVPRREGDRSELLSAEYVHRWLSAGRNPPATPPRDTGTPIGVRADSRLDDLIELVG